MTLSGTFFVSLISPKDINVPAGPRKNNVAIIDIDLAILIISSIHGNPDETFAKLNMLW